MNNQEIVELPKGAVTIPPMRVEKVIRPLADIEREYILYVLQAVGNNKTKAAEALQVSLKTLYNKLNAYKADGLL